MTDSDSGGPYLVAALICERILTEKDNVHSLVRVIDRTTVTTQGPASKMDMPPLKRKFWMFLSFKSGDARGSETIKVTITKPDGLTSAEPVTEGSIHFEGGTKGANLILEMEIGFETQGPYWFNIYVDDKLKTKTPYEVIHVHRRIITRGEPA